jgi:hypothetical protein
MMRKLSMPLMLLVLAFSTFTVRATTPRLPFVEDDYAKALGEARQRKLPVFVDVWAPW